MGYARAGFEVVGVDVEPQPDYPFEFRQADAMFVAQWAGLSGEWDAIHASPPCQAYTALRVAANAREHPRLIEPLRELLVATGLPYVIENVPQAPLRNALVLGGESFGLGVEAGDSDWSAKTLLLLGSGGRRALRRHRLFETSFAVMASPCWHRLPVIGFYGDHARAQRRSDPLQVENEQDFPDADRVGLARVAMGINWTDSWDSLREAIPPAFTEHIGTQLRAALEGFEVEEPRSYVYGGIE